MLAALSEETFGTYVGDGNGADDRASIQLPKTQSVVMLDPKRRLEDGNGNDEVGGEKDVLFPINRQTMGIEWLFDNIEVSCNIGQGREFVDDVVVCIGFDYASWRSSSYGAHVSDEKSSDRC